MRDFWVGVGVGSGNGCGNWFFNLLVGVWYFVDFCFCVGCCVVVD